MNLNDNKKLYTLKKIIVFIVVIKIFINIIFLLKMILIFLPQNILFFKKSIGASKIDEHKAIIKDDSIFDIYE